MLGILLIFFIGRYFYNLAQQYNKNGWLYAFAGILSYYAGGFLVGFAYVILAEVFLWETSESMENLLLAILSLPFGILACYLFYNQLEKQFQGKLGRNQSNTLDEELFQ